jgi:hypothetical protein
MMSDNSATPSNESSQPNSEKPSRNPLEKLVVWGAIAIGLIIVGIEARAKLGYDLTLSGLANKMKEIDESGNDSQSLTYESAQSYLKFGPVVSEEQPEGNLRKSRTLEWFSLAKEYKMKLILDDDGTLLFVETSDPPPEPEPEMIPESDEDDDGMVEPAESGTPPGGEVAEQEEPETESPAKDE